MTMISAVPSYSYNIDDRMRSISTNAVQEARIAKGRGGLPFLDKDSRIQNMIERLLHELTDVKSVDQSVEHFPLVDKNQEEIGKRITTMSEILNKLEDEFVEKPLKATVSAKTSAKK